MTRFSFAILAFALTGCSSGGARVDTIMALDGDSANGGAVYADHCASCHGADGNGGAEEGILGEDEDEGAEVVDVVLNGKERMPSFADTLSDQDIADLLAWIAEQG